MKRFSLYVLLSLTLTVAVKAQSFGTTVLVTGDTDVLTDGTLVLAYDVSGSTTPVNGVTFGNSSAFAETFSQNGVTLTNSGFPNADNNGVNFPVVSSELGAVLGDNIYSFGASTLTLTDLTPFVTYEFQIFDGTTGVGFGNIALGNNSATGTLSYGVSANEDSTAYYTIETFVAPSSGKETISMFPTNGFTIVDAAELREIPEPSSYALFFAGVAGFGAILRFRRKAAVL